MSCEANKVRNSVCSFMYDFTSKKLSKMDDFKHTICVVLLSAAAGRLKNLVMASFCTWLSHNLSTEVTHILPLETTAAVHATKIFAPVVINVNIWTVF
jgi:hypothetical protein